MRFQSLIVLGSSLLGLSVAAPAGAHNTGLQHNYYYMGCYGYTLQGDSSIVPTNYSYGYPLGGQIQSLQQCAKVCQDYYAWIVGDGLFLYCLNDRSLFLPAGAAAGPYCRNPCPANPNQKCGGLYGSGEFALFEQA